MKIRVEELGKRFNYATIFKDFTYQFEKGNSYAILGSNGSGKSTLLKTLIAYYSPSSGSLNWTDDEQKFHPDHYHRYFAITAPYLDLIEDLSLRECLEYHFKFKESVLSVDEIIERLNFTKHQHKSISLFSSGMKQRVKLSLNLFANVQVSVFDEPTMNLDDSGTKWFLEELEKVKKERIVFIASNDPKEYSTCDQIIEIEKYQ